jgi:hypothetical protein
MSDDDEVIHSVRRVVKGLQEGLTSANWFADASDAWIVDEKRFLELVPLEDPLLPHPRGNEDDDLTHLVSRQDFGDSHCKRDEGLSHTHLVGEDYALLVGKALKDLLCCPPLPLPVVCERPIDPRLECGA